MGSLSLREMEYLVLDPKAGKYLNHPYRELTEFLQRWEVVKSCTVLRQVLCSILSWLPKICLRNAFPQGLSHSLPRSGIFFFCTLWPLSSQSHHIDHDHFSAGLLTLGWGYHVLKDTTCQACTRHLTFIQYLQ